MAGDDDPHVDRAGARRDLESSHALGDPISGERPQESRRDAGALARAVTGPRRGLPGRRRYEKEDEAGTKGVSTAGRGHGALAFRWE